MYAGHHEDKSMVTKPWAHFLKMEQDRTAWCFETTIKTIDFYHVKNFSVKFIRWHTEGIKKRQKKKKTFSLDCIIVKQYETSFVSQIKF